MGDFRIVINAVGGHGQDRSKKHGEKVDFTGDSGYHSATTPETIAQVLIAALRSTGCSIDSAKVIHWPADNYPDQREAGKEVVDDLLTGVRTGSFDGK
jgi:hypothetical protein